MARHHLAALVAACAFAAAPARGAPPDELFDGLKYLEYDLYDFTPEEQADWEASRYARQAVRLEDGSVTLREVYATLEGQANLFPTEWMQFHFDLRDDRTREAEVARFSADLLVRAGDALELGITGSPDVMKDEGAWGLAALVHSADRSSYAIARVTQDRPLYNLKNLDGGHRDADVLLRAQAEARGQRGRASAWGRIDLGMPARYDFPGASPLGVQARSEYRSEGEAHLRWEPALLGAGSGGSLGLRLSARRLDGGQTAQLQRSELRRGLVFARGYLLVPIAPSLRARAVALYLEERARGLDSGAPFAFSRRDLGVRVGAVWTSGPFALEAGYGWVRSQQELSTAGAVPLSYSPDWNGDKAYATATWRTGPASLRMLVSHQVLSGHFGGLGGSLGAVF
jgi:hypothetical protein